MIDIEYFITVVLDTRKANVLGLFPLKLRVFTPYPRLQKLYSIGYTMTEKEFNSVWLTIKPSREYIPVRIELQAILARANTLAKQLNTFDVIEFERLYFKHHSVKDINYFYDKAIDQYIYNEQIGTAVSYRQSLKSLLRFAGKESIPFTSITKQFLNDYERDMIKVRLKSSTTVGIYLRPLRAIFNTAIVDKAISRDYYPFAKGKYVIPAPKAVKKALSNEQLKTLYESIPANQYQQQAKDIWFFSYFNNGMNIADILQLQNKDITSDTVSFKRVKTLHTNKNQSLVTAYLNDYTRYVLYRYGNTDTNKESYVFPFIDHSDTPTEQHRKKLIFIRIVNDHFLQLAKANGIHKVSTYYARHSFATQAIQKGASMEFVSQALSHSNLNTTMSYFEGFENAKKREFAELLSQF